MRVDISEYDEKIEFVNPVVFTPTFILTKNLREIARMRGILETIYFGECWKWYLNEKQILTKFNNSK